MGYLKKLDSLLGFIYWKGLALFLSIFLVVSLFAAYANLKDGVGWDKLFSLIPIALAVFFFYCIKICFKNSTLSKAVEKLEE